MTLSANLRQGPRTKPSASVTKRRLRAAALVSVCFVAAPPLLALDPSRSIKQYEHTRWTASEGAPSGVTSIIQTPDGYLWLASDDGLMRFDGLIFERIDGALDQASEGVPWYVANGSDGAVLAWYPASKRLRVYNKGELRTLPAPDLEGTLVDLKQTPNGDIWLADGRPNQPMLRYHAGRWSKVSPEKNFGSDTCMGMVIAADGALWVAYENNVFRRSPGESRFQHMISDRGARMRLSLDPAGRVWVTGGGGSRPITEPKGLWTGRPARFRYPSDNSTRRGRPLFDRNGNLWVARRKFGLERLRKPSPLGPTNGLPQRDEFRATDGLTSDSVYAVFEDREGNIWVATTVGLDRFRDADIISEPPLKQPAAFGDILFADSVGNVFIGQENTVYRVEPGGLPRPVLTKINEPEAICEGPSGAIWIALPDSIAVVGRDGKRMAKPVGLGSVADCGVDRWGRFWFSGREGGLYVLTSSGWQQVFTGSSSLFRPAQMVRDANGNLWVNGGLHTLARLDRTGPTILKIPNKGLKDVRTIAPLGDGLLLAGLDGLALFREGRLSSIAANRVGSLLRVNGLIQTRRGETWILSNAGLSRFRTGDLLRGLRDNQFRIPGRTLGYLDGMPDSNSVRTTRALVEGGDGRLWAATASGVVWIDPARLTYNFVSPKIAIRSLETGGRRFLDPDALTLPAGSSNVTIGFAALSLRIPERVQVRYRLEGQDQGWINPGLRRQAFYTNLGPGRYRFRVIAANENGIWNTSGASLVFDVPPTFVQSIWFKLLLVLILAGALGAAYVIQVRQVTAQLQSRFHIRVAERERIARELHDTLLQGFQGLLLHFKAIANQLSETNEARQLIDAALNRAQQVLIEGRDRVKELRFERRRTAGLANALVQRASAHVAGGRPHLILVEEGTARSLHPLVEEELERITEEAVQNAVSHANASTVELLLQWTWRGLRLSIRDDGCGLPPSVTSEGKREGHFGLLGMQERANRIGGTFSLESRKGWGTEVSVEVPNRGAYEDNWPRVNDRLWRGWCSVKRRMKRRRGAEQRSPESEVASEPHGERAPPAGEVSEIIGR
jgi:signal transduction histidine kinase/ligand-binding sensor domain-containing protein